MSMKTEIVVRRASYCKSFSVIFRRASFSTPTRFFNNRVGFANSESLVNIYQR
jgi:hypothetical protein